MKDFEGISETSPYTCARCLNAAYRQTISEMKDTIVALKLEVSELRTALSDLSNKQADTQGNQWSDVVRRSTKGSRKTQQRAIGTDERQSETQRVNRQRETPAENGLRHKGRRARVHVAGARKVWGTHKNATTSEVKGAITMLGNIPTSDLAVKRKFKTVQASNRATERWWFVLRAEEAILKGLEEKWNSMALPHRWKLEPLLCYAESDSESSQALAEQERNPTPADASHLSTSASTVDHPNDHNMSQQQQYSHSAQTAPSATQSTNPANPSTQPITPRATPPIGNAPFLGELSPTSLPVQ